jgi:hypothetical protein
MALPRDPCALCGQKIVWVTRLSDNKRITIDPDADYTHGTLARVNPDIVQGRQDVVEIVPEEERWMRARLYTSHYTTCPEQQRCIRMGIREFAECRKLVEEARQGRGMTQSMREDVNPQDYMLDRSQ